VQSQNLETKEPEKPIRQPRAPGVERSDDCDSRKNDKQQNLVWPNHLSHPESSTLRGMILRIMGTTDGLNAR
jgi:hypothetical protein